VFTGLPSTLFDSDPGIRVRYEHTAGWWQSEWGAVTPASGSAPYQVQATWLLGACAGGARLDTSANSTGGLARIRFDASGIVYYDAAGAVIAPGSDPWLVPDAAVRVEGIRVTVDWSAQRWRLDAASATLAAAICTPAPTPSPSPTPTPTSEDTP